MKHTRLTDDLQEQASLYAAGAMTESEREQYARHLEEDECAVCRSEVTELQSSISLLAFTLPSSGPSPSVKTRLMQQAESARPVVVPRPPAFRWIDWITAAVAVASMAVAFVAIRANGQLRRNAAELNSRIAQLEVQVTQQRQIADVVFSPGARVVDLAGQGKNVQASGRIVWDRQRSRAIFSVANLPAPASDKSYQLWFVTKTGEKLSADIFETDNGSHVAELAVPEGMLAAAAVTTEPRGGSRQPTAGGFELLGAM